MLTLSGQALRGPGESASWVWGHKEKCLLLLRVPGGPHTSSHWLENSPKGLMVSGTLKSMRPQFPMSRMGETPPTLAQQGV